ncbi:hypothetical protein THAOC_24044 [Thalassiosira oceanica]|uniref:Ribosomal RNA-processing protein 17 n=1 Tax=Thalassiosira oceanica TaxID=159749 RepID=K0S5F4_THAOC|nr:hypothetical protein THAOC_24044 [Thalassiosira oceanica]|mmetsp:Transcript_11220/g.26230  ORF Transcript_11220/g.26230 Transcript_11220/m.26230 type:complete len:260 (-) Transcript_11220:71-850(-)|eukprot:EJK56126.1 hypothetical protein THAOC_24044 [Thalassiosira oceanica]
MGKTTNDAGSRGSGGRGKRPHSSKAKTSFPRHRKVEISFNPEDRRGYLTGLSARKKERRAFGLAMQKVKDRQAKIEERKEQRQAQLEKIEDIERNKKALRRGQDGEVEAGSDAESESKLGQDIERESHTFQDDQTRSQFGGLVSVTTTYGMPEDDDSVTDDRHDFYSRETHDSNHVDEAQKQAGNVNSYIAKVKGSMGSRKKHQKSGGRKGTHGASTMKGMGNANEMKMAKKTLAKYKAKRGKNDRETGGKGKRRKGRR